MNEKEKQLGVWLSKIADELNITPTMLDKAVSSYTGVGTWLSDGIIYDVKIMPQGSMNLGTVVRPISEKDEYDVDLVCLLKSGTTLPLSRIKNVVGDRLKEHGTCTYRQMLDKEGKRCWTMQYDEFHMDILPCVPKNSYYIEPYLTSVKLTHKNNLGVYEPRYSDPYAYHRWFEGQMKDILHTEKGEYAVRNNVDISEVPTYRVRTPLQKAIQLLKRHRDILFQGNPDDAPISIIITTLAALSYCGETNVYEVLRNIVEKMPQFIERRGENYWIANPVMQEENFADKWNIEPNKRTMFMFWLQNVKKDLITDPLSCFGQDSVTNQYKRVLGTTPVERAVRAMGNATRTDRENGRLYINGLTGGLTTTPLSNSKPVKEHTFFGK